MRKWLPILIITLFWTSLSFCKASAEGIVNGYSLSLDSIDDSALKTAIASLNYLKENNEWNLYVNNKIVKEKIAENIYYFESETLGTIKITLDPDELLVNLQYQQITNETVTSMITIKHTEGYHSLLFFPNIENDNYLSVDSETIEGKIYFEPFTADFDEETYRYQVIIDQTAEKVIIIRNGISLEYRIYKNTSLQSVFLETLVPAHSLDVEYLKKDLTLRSFSDAKNRLYTEDEINHVVRNESLTLKSRKSGLTLITALSQFITYWQRIGEEEYDIGVSEQRQVVCQWSEAACQSVRQQLTDSGRKYAVFGSNFEYGDIAEYDLLEYELITEKLYKNMTWPEYLWIISDKPASLANAATQMRINEGTWSAWSTYSGEDNRTECEDNADCEYRTKWVYRTKSASWGNWSAYSVSFPLDCNDNADCTWQKQIFYNKRTGSWNAYSSYANQYPADCNDNADCTWKSLKYYRYRTASAKGTYSAWKSSCSVTDDYRCSSYYKYTCKKNLSVNTRYSATSYAVNTQGLCDSGYKVSSKSAGYRYQYLQWSAWSTYSTASCSSSVGYRKCESETRYATSKRTWSSWTGYNQLTCISDANTQCSGPVSYYRTKYRYWSAWSPNSDISCTENADTKCEKEKQYAYKYRNWSGWSGWVPYDPAIKIDNNQKVTFRINQGLETWDRVAGTSTIIGEGCYYLNETKDISSGYQPVTNHYIKTSLTTLGTKPAMTESEIENLGNLIAEAVMKNLTAQELLKSYGKINQTLWKTEGRNKLFNYYQNGMTVKGKLLNSLIFIPYIYVREHYRAVQQMMNIMGYNGDYQLINTNERKQVFSEEGTLQAVNKTSLNDSRVIYYDYQDPLADYSVLPGNWSGYDALLDELKNADFEEYELRITLSNSDIAELNSYLDNGGYQRLGNCDMLRHFSYLFIDPSGKLKTWLGSVESGCQIVNSD